MEPEYQAPPDADATEALMVRGTGSVSVGDDGRLDTEVEGCPKHDTAGLISHTDR